jgi:hypothetical protein
VREWGGDPEKLVAFVVSTNLHRRHLSETARGMIAGKLANLSNGTNLHRPMIEGSPIGLPSVSQTEAADLLNVGLNTVKRSKSVIDHGVPELVREVEQDRVSVSAAAEIARLPEQQHRAFVTWHRGSCRFLLRRGAERSVP